MNIRQLTIFRRVCREKQFTRAADTLYMTQPAVSRAIRELEEELGYPLFERMGRKIVLTGAGQLFLERAERVLEAYSQLTAPETEVEARSPIRVGSSITIANFRLPGILKRFEERWPQVPVRVTVERAADIERRLMDNTVDLAMIEGLVRHPVLKKTPLSVYPIAAVCAPGHPLAQQSDAVSLKVFLDQKLLLREPGSAVRDSLDSALTLRHAAAEPYWVSVNSQALIEAAAAGLGIAVLPRILVEGWLADGRLREIFVEDLRIENTNYLAVHPEKHLTPPMRDLIQLITQEG